MNYLPSANMNYRLRRYELLNGQPFNVKCGLPATWKNVYGCGRVRSLRALRLVEMTKGARGCHFDRNERSECSGEI